MSEELLRKAAEMRNAIDMIEGALMGLGNFTDLPDLFEGTAEHVSLAPKMTVGEMRRVCTALAECTRIINSDEFAPDELRHFREMKRTKRRTEARLKIAIMALKLIADENAQWSEMQQIAREALKQATATVTDKLFDTGEKKDVENG